MLRMNFYNLGAWLRTIFIQSLKDVFPFKKRIKHLDLSCKTDLDIWNCFGKKTLVGSKIVQDLSNLHICGNYGKGNSRLAQAVELETLYL